MPTDYTRLWAEKFNTVFAVLRGFPDGEEDLQRAVLQQAILQRIGNRVAACVHLESYEDVLDAGVDEDLLIIRVNRQGNHMGRRGNFPEKPRGMV